ncbi:MAG: class I SAM-dependent methyltransferase [Gammaproteobacteria bacterium]|nr:class I SAM-dependent methyltransferase [Gammaproteobacteria bacterium]
MSSYENYTQTSAVYDHTRVPVGLEIISAALSAGSTKPDRQILLDAGCGTGIYTFALIDQVHRVEAVDLNRSMLSVARSKMDSTAENGRIGFTQGSITQLPFKTRSVDSVMMNQVLHHLPDQAGDGWPLHHQALKECARVLRPGGVLIINSCTHEQLEKGFWFYELIPNARTAVMRKIIPEKELDTLLCSVGLTLNGRMVDFDGVLQGESYFDAEAVLDYAWRKGDSIWTLASDHELQTALTRIAELSARNKLQSFMQRYDVDRPTVGQTSFSVAIKN